MYKKGYSDFNILPDAYIHILEGERVPDYFLIQDFEADFP